MKMLKLGLYLPDTDITDIHVAKTYTTIADPYIQFTDTDISVLLSVKYIGLICFFRARIVYTYILGCANPPLGVILYPQVYNIKDNYGNSFPPINI